MEISRPATLNYVYMPKGSLAPVSFFFRNKSTCSFFKTNGKVKPGMWNGNSFTLNMRSILMR